MFQHKPSLGTALLAILTASTVTAQPASSSAAAGQAMTSPVYRSAMDGYQSYTDEKVAPWGDSNDTVGRVGGWRAYSKESRGTATPAPASPAGLPAQPQPAPNPAPDAGARPASSAAPAPAAKAVAPDPHAGHGKQ